MPQPSTEDWDRINKPDDDPYWRLCLDLKAAFIERAKDALVRHNLDYAAMCRRQARHWHERRKQKRLNPKL